MVCVCVCVCVFRILLFYIMQYSHRTVFLTVHGTRLVPNKPLNCSCLHPDNTSIIDPHEYIQLFTKFWRFQLGLSCLQRKSFYWWTHIPSSQKLFLIICLCSRESLQAIFLRSKGRTSDIHIFLLPL